MSAHVAWVRRRLPWLAVLAASCSDPREAERTVGAGEAIHALPTVDVWTAVQAGDFNDDGFQDALWNNANRSQMAISLLRGTELLSAGPPLQGPSTGTGWVTIAPADFNGDGMTDVPWFDVVNGRFAVWLMHGAQVLSEGPVLPGPTGGTWIAAQAGDFDGDGLSDVLWYEPFANRIAVWLTRGSGLSRMGADIPGPAGEGWSVAGLGDFNLDGMADILWYAPDEQKFAIWLMRGTRLLERGPEIPAPPGDGWQPVATADFNGDGMTDLLWNNLQTGDITVWPVRGTRILEQGPVLPGPGGSDWVAAAAGDTNGDGMADVLWQNLVTRGMQILADARDGGPRPGSRDPGSRVSATSNV